MTETLLISRNKVYTDTEAKQTLTDTIHKLYTPEGNNNKEQETEQRLIPDSLESMTSDTSDKLVIDMDGSPMSSATNTPTNTPEAQTINGVEITPKTIQQQKQVQTRSTTKWNETNKRQPKKSLF